MTARLTGIRGSLTGRAFELSDQPLTIGRAADNHIAVASPRASRRHAQIRREGAAFVLYDLGSANGTLVNGQRVQRAVLQPGDLIDIGDEVFRFEAAHPQDATVLSPPTAAQAYPSQSLSPSVPQSPSVPPTAPAGLPYPASPPAYPPSAPPTTPAPAATPSASQPGMPPSAHPPQATYPHQPPPVVQPPAYAPPPRTKSGGRSWLLAVVALLTLVCMAGAAGAFIFRDRLRDVPVIGNLPGGGGITPTIARPPAQTVSATVGSGQAAAISMPGGPMIEVPPGAVPPNPDGSPGTLTFSVAPAPEMPVSLPPDMALAGPLYQFEPEGVTFAVPVRITLPIPAGTDAAQVMGLITRDPQSGAWVPVTGIVDAAARTVSAEVTHFSPYGVYRYTGSDVEAWQRANGGWFVIENPSLRGSLTYPGCRNLPRALYVNVCIQQVNLSDPGLSYLLPADRLLALGPRQDYGAPYRPLKAWLPAGVYRVVHYLFMSEVNNDPMYIPCYGWWVKPPQVINLRAGQSVTFEPFSEADGTPMTSFDVGTCTGTPAPGAPVAEQPPQQPPQQQPGQPIETSGVCPAKMNGEWDATLKLRETNNPEWQDEIGDTHTTILAIQINGSSAQVQFVNPNGERSDVASGTCTVQDGRYVVDIPETGSNVAMAFNLQFKGDNRMTGDVIASKGEIYSITDVDMTRRTGAGQTPPDNQSSTCAQEAELINNRYMGACGVSDTQTFELTQRVFVTRIRVWHNPRLTGTDTPNVTITGPNGYNFSGTTTKGGCYAGWCEAMVSLNQELSPGTYRLSIPTASICTDPSGKTTLILYGCATPGQSSSLPVPDPASIAYVGGFAGQWSTNWGDMTCRVEGTKVYCEYTHDQGRIEATLSADGRTMDGQWAEYPSYSPPRDGGRVIFRLSDDGNAISGEWWYGQDTYGGSWTGTRK